MKRRAFTLIELLGVLVILALIVLLAWTRLSGTLNEVKKTLSEDNLKLIYSAAESYIEKNTAKFPRTSGNTYCVSLEILADEGLLPDDLKNYITEQQISMERTVQVTINSKRKYNFDFDESKNICDLSVNATAKTRKNRLVVDGEVIGEDIIVTLTKLADQGTVKYCVASTSNSDEEPTCTPNKEYADEFTIPSKTSDEIADEGNIYIGYKENGETKTDTIKMTKEKK